MARTTRRWRRARALVTPDDAPRIAIPFEEDSREMVRYFASAITDQDVQDALSLVGAWSDLDWDEMIEALDRIRHESEPPPPVETDG
jgi:hypothetical protein